MRADTFLAGTSCSRVGRQSTRYEQVRKSSPQRATPQPQRAPRNQPGSREKQKNNKPKNGHRTPQRGGRWGGRDGGGVSEASGTECYNTPFFLFFANLLGNHLASTLPWRPLSGHQAFSSGSRHCTTVEHALPPTTSQPEAFFGLSCCWTKRSFNAFWSSWEQPPSSMGVLPPASSSSSQYPVHGPPKRCRPTSFQSLPARVPPPRNPSPPSTTPVVLAATRNPIGANEVEVRHWPALIVRCAG